MVFAVKVTLSIDGKSYGANGTKYVTLNSGEAHTVKTYDDAVALVATCKEHAIIDETYEIVEI